jgi:hypothetical protein
MKEAERKAKQEAKDAADRAVELQRQLEAGKAGLSGEILEKWNADKAKELAARDQQIAELNQSLRALRLDDKVKAAALEAGMFPKHTALTLKALSDRFDLADDGTIVVKGEDGKPTPKPLGEFFAAHKQEFPELYQAAPASGGGAKPPASRPTTTIDRNDKKAFLANLDNIAAGKVAVT